MAQTRPISFARINRRDAGQDTLPGRTFAEDMRVLAESRRTTFIQKSTTSRPMRRWTAADLELTADGDFMTGLLGFSEQLSQVAFDNETFSWRKGDVTDSDSANDQTIVPFAVDLRPENRWVAFATTSRVRTSGFRHGLEHALNAAIADIAEIPSDWEVDLVTSREVINRWLDRNQLVFELVRTVKFSNPGLDVDADRAQMRALAANRKTEVFRARRSSNLDTSAAAFHEKLAGTEKGDLPVRMLARGSQRGQVKKFNSDNSPDRVEVADFGGDPSGGIEATLSALRDYAATRGDGGDDGSS